MEAETAMHYRTFDTHKYIKSLQETGFNEKQAEMLIKSLLESRDFELSTLATREQVAKVEAKLGKEISAIREQVAKVEVKLDKEISATRDQITKVESKLEKKIDRVESKLEKQIIQVKSDLQKEIDSVKYDLLKWILPLIVPMFGMMALIIFKMFSNL